MAKLKYKPEPHIIEWLLEKNNPSVRYFTLKDIQKKSNNNPQLKAAKKAIMTGGIVPEILSKQQPEGCWGDPMMFYRDKYKGTVWQLIILASLGADGKDKRIKKACEFILRHSQERKSKGFSTDYSKTNDCGTTSYVIPCLTGNMVWSLIRLGYLNDKRVKAAINHITKYQRFDDFDAAPPKGWPYDRFDMCYGRHTCHMGAAKTLKALSEIPGSKRTPDMNKTLNKGIEYFLKHHIFKKSHDLKQTAKPGWLRLEFPLMYQSDILEILDILTRLGCKDKRMNEAIEKLKMRRDDNGKWKLQSTFNGRFQTNIEQKGKASKWITLNAVKVLMRL